MTRPRMILAVLAIALLGLALTACGDDEDGDTTIVNTTTVIEGGGEDVQSTTLTVDEPPADDSDDSDDDPADDDPAQVVSLERFRSPSGNIACLMSAKSVRCDIAEKTWEAPRPPGCPGASDFGQGLTLNASGPAQVVCAGDTVLDPQAPVLDYEAVSRIGPLSCESDESGIECSNESGGEFKLSREEYEVE